MTKQEIDNQEVLSHGAQKRQDPEDVGLGDMRIDGGKVKRAEDSAKELDALAGRSVVEDTAAVAVGRDDGNALEVVGGSQLLQDVLRAAEESRRREVR